MKEERVRVLKAGEELDGAVAYWMSRDQRVDDNWALIFARDSAMERRAPLVVVFCMVPAFLGAAYRQYAFMIKGLSSVERRLATLNIPFVLLEGEPAEAIGTFVKTHGVGHLVTDFDPLRVKREWKRSVCETVGVQVSEVDAHNIVPCWEASPKREYGAFTFRRKMRRLIGEYLHDFPVMERHPFSWNEKKAPTDWRRVEKSLKADRKVGEAAWLGPGEREAHAALRRFLAGPAVRYIMRNDPTQHVQSDLSPYLHFGHICAQRVALETDKADIPAAAKESFLEELIVRRELSDNFCYYCDRYDTLESFPEWAKKTLQKHWNDRREYIYDLSDLEAGDTHDDLWNAAQLEMVRRGKMAGYMRMYWAKKILEWSPSPEEALRAAIYLNDRYELDGRDPNGYTGIAWAMGGVHDRPWGERPVFGSLRFMSYRGCKSKFNIQKYMDSI